jgi:hypothetical protein
MASDDWGDVEARLERLRPSDIARIKSRLGDTPFRMSLLDRFYRYLGSLETPSAVDLDDVTRITRQLAKAGLWDMAGDVAVMRQWHAAFDYRVLAALTEALPRNAKATLRYGEAAAAAV